MPYIREAARDYMRGPTQALADVICTKADLCYAVAVLMRAYARESPILDASRAGWSGMSDAIAAVECAKLDFYAMVVQPYEEQKKKANGDVP